MTELIIVWRGGVWLGYFQKPKMWNLTKLTLFSRSITIYHVGSGRFISEKNIIQIIGFKSTNSNSQFQRKNQFWIICTETQDINKNV